MTTELNVIEDEPDSIERYSDDLRLISETEARCA